MTDNRKHIEQDTNKSIKHPFLYGFVAFVLYYVVFQSFYNKITKGTIFPYKDCADMLTGVTINFIPIFALFVADAGIVFRLVRVRNTKWKLVVDFLMTNVAVVVINFAYLFLLSGSILGHLNWAGTLFNNFILFFAIETVYYVINFQQKLREVEEQKQMTLRYQYNALKAQVNPHFLFNSLSILTALISLDHAKAKDFVTWLSQVYRYTMAKQDVELATLQEELSFMHSYASILSMRYHDKFSVKVYGEENAGSQLLIPYTLQLLIENITKHNVVSTRYPMEVEVRIGKDSMTVANPIRFRPSDTASHFGLRYLTSLYASYGKTFKTENDGKTFTAYIQFIRQ